MTAFANSNSRKLTGFDVTRGEKLKNFYTVYRELENKIIYQKKDGVTDHPSELNLSKVKAYQPFMCLQFFSRACTHAWRSMALRHELRAQ